MNSKHWWESKTIWSGVLAVGIAVYNALGQPVLEHFHVTLPMIPDFVYGILAAFGIYGRKAATSVIK